MTKKLLFLGLFTSGILWLSLTLVKPARAAHKMQSDDGNAYPGQCLPWVQVNSNGFGMASNFDAQGTIISPPPLEPYQGEEGFEVAVFKGKLYFGMEADNVFGARLWRTRSAVSIPQTQDDWEEVIGDASGKPFGLKDRSQNDHIDSVLEFNGYIYVSTGTRSEANKGFRLFRSQTGDPGSWEDALNEFGPGFGDVHNENFKDMQVFQNQLCGGTWNTYIGAQVWCSPDGIHWKPKSAGGFGDPANKVIWSGGTFGEGLYFGVQNSGDDQSSSDDDRGELFRTSNISGTPNWEEVFSGPASSYVVNILDSFQSQLYISTFSPQGVVLYRSTTGSPHSWVQASKPGMADSRMEYDPFNNATTVDGALVYNDDIYVSVSNPLIGFGVWRMNGNLSTANSINRWEKILKDYPADPGNIHANLASFNGYLYAWTTNYRVGQQVLRTKCPICQLRVIKGPGRYTFDQVGASVNFTASNLDQVEICVYPDAYFSSLFSTNAVKRYYKIAITPMGASYRADLTLAYRNHEVLPSKRSGEQYSLVRWDGSRSKDCPSTQFTSQSDGGYMTCLGTSNLSAYWLITSKIASSDHVGANQPSTSEVFPILSAAAIIMIMWLITFLQDRTP